MEETRLIFLLHQVVIMGGRACLFVRRNRSHLHECMRMEDGSNGHNDTNLSRLACLHVIFSERKGVGEGWERKQETQTDRETDRHKHTIRTAGANLFGPVELWTHKHADFLLREMIFENYLPSVKIDHGVVVDGHDLAGIVDLNRTFSIDTLTDSIRIKTEGINYDERLVRLLCILDNTYILIPSS